MLVHRGIDKAEGSQLGGKVAQQHELLLRTRVRLRRFICLGIVLDVFQETIEDGGHRVDFSCS
jgi:hypothetical protein